MVWIDCPSCSDGHCHACDGDRVWCEHACQWMRQGAKDGAMTLLTMFDAVQVTNLPHVPGAAYAGYVGGEWPNYPDVVRLFPHSLHLSIAVASRFDADCLDIEQGDATPVLAPGWVERQKIRGVYRPVLYCSQSTLPDVMHALAGAKIQRAAVRLLSAHTGRGQHICAPQTCGAVVACDGTQWQQNYHGHDTSVLLPGFFAGVPVPADGPVPLAAATVQALQTINTNLPTRHVPVPVNERGLLTTAAGEISRVLTIK